MGKGEQVGSEQDSLEALCGCPMLLLGDKGDDDDYEAQQRKRMDQLRRLHLIGILKGIGGEEDRNRLGEEQLQRKLKRKERHGER